MAVSLQVSSPGPLGVSWYVFTGITAPAQYMPTVRFEAIMNKPRSNTNMKVDMEYPLLQVVDGVTSVTNTFKSSFTFTALRGVSSDTERMRVLDEMIAFLTANKARIAVGSVLPVS